MTNKTERLKLVNEIMKIIEDLDSCFNNTIDLNLKNLIIKSQLSLLNIVNTVNALDTKICEHSGAVLEDNNA